MTDQPNTERCDGSGYLGTGPSWSSRPCPGCPACRPCEECGGKGYLLTQPGAGDIPCLRCDGTGVER
jgi:hypothetical protein